MENCGTTKCSVKKIPQSVDTTPVPRHCFGHPNTTFKIQKYYKVNFFELKKMGIQIYNYYQISRTGSKAEVLVSKV